MIGVTGRKGGAAILLSNKKPSREKHSRSLRLF